MLAFCDGEIDDPVDVLLCFFGAAFNIRRATDGFDGGVGFYCVFYDLPVFSVLVFYLGVIFVLIWDREYSLLCEQTELDVAFPFPPPF